MLLQPPHFSSDFSAPHFRTNLLSWYERHARRLPWRETRDPYRIWLSEIMLQQTRVAAVIGHYREFVQRFPTVEKLAAARESSVLAAWSGLGYYRRARMLHAAAKQIVREEEFPRTSVRLQDLPGIGRYTAAAIASIAFGEPVAVVDGNVERVLQRVSGTRISGCGAWVAAGDLLDTGRPGDFNQAMMELGAVVCTPRSPGCLTCPVIESCVTRGELQRENRPKQQKKKEIHFALHCREKTVLLVQRSRNASLMPGMWELPEFEARPIETNHTAVTLSAKPQNGVHSGRSKPLFRLKHAITVTDYSVVVWCYSGPANDGGKWIPTDKLKSVALTGLARKILRKAGMF